MMPNKCGGDHSTESRPKYSCHKTSSTADEPMAATAMPDRTRARWRKADHTERSSTISKSAHAITTAAATATLAYSRMWGGANVLSRPISVCHAPSQYVARIAAEPAATASHRNAGGDGLESARFRGNDIVDGLLTRVAYPQGVSRDSITIEERRSKFFPHSAGRRIEVVPLAIGASAGAEPVAHLQHRSFGCLFREAELVPCVGSGPMRGRALGGRLRPRPRSRPAPHGRGRGQSDRGRPATHRRARALRSPPLHQPGRLNRPGRRRRAGHRAALRVHRR